MCMLFKKPAGLVLPENYFASLWKQNSDGLAAYNYTTKDLFKTLDRKAAYDYLVANADDEMIVHFRFGTSGAASLDQVHGFELKNDWLFFHNGVLSTFKGTWTHSDTQQLVEEFNNWNYTPEEIVDYLEAFERSSRFLLVNKVTNETLQPDCAKWNSATRIDGYDVCFSNTYAIDTQLLGDAYKPTSLWGGSKYYSGSYGGGSYGYDNYGYDDYGVTDEDDKDPIDYDSDEVSVLLAELASYVESKDYKLVHDFAMVYPDVVAKFLVS